MLKPILDQTVLVEAGDLSSDFISRALEIKYMDNIGIQLKWTGNPVGLFSVQVSANYKEDINHNVINPGDWVSIPASPLITGNGVPDLAYIDINELSSLYLRIKFTRTSGTGVLNCIAVGKMI
jgi:hypothetical protein